VLAAEYKTALPDEEVLAAELDRTQKSLAAAKPDRKRWRVMRARLRATQSPQNWHQTGTSPKVDQLC
jgi:hypothetical protein